MRSSSFVVYVCCLLTCMTGCKKFLETTPQDFLSPENYYQTEDDIVNALGAVYVTLGSNYTYGRYMVIDGAMDDLGYWNQSEVSLIDRLSGWNYTAAQPQIMMMWQRLYEGIERANVLLENIDRPEMEEADRQVYKGEAIFLRAYYHYLLADQWGDVPMRMTANQSVTDVNVAPTAAQAVMQQAVNDIEEVVNNQMLQPANAFPHSSRVTMTVAEGILARIYLKLAGQPFNLPGMYEKAYYWASQVKSSGLHQLNPDYDQIFINQSQDLYDTQYRESMWEAEFNGNSTTDPGKSDKYSWVGVTNGIICYDDGDNLGYSYGYIRTRLKLWDLFDEEDRRKYRSIANYRYNVTDNTKYNERITTFGSIAERCAAKWRREEETLKPKDKNYNATNFPILRYADVLLMMAEAENEVNGPTDAAFAAINEVRQRAGVKPYGLGTGPDVITISGADDLRQVIRDERARELCWEGIRRHDLIRWGIFEEAMRQAAAEPYQSENTGNGRTSDASQRAIMGAIAAKMSEKYRLYPVPQKELNLNNQMKQNKFW